MNQTTDSPPPTARRAPAIVAAVVSLAVMGGVVAMALTGRDEEPPSRAPIDIPSSLPPGVETPLPDAMAAGCTSIDPDNPPVLSFELPDNTADFGPVRQSERRTMEVTFKNTGNGLLCVTRVSTGCGCLKVRFKNLGKKMYNPGETGVIVMVLDTTNQEGVLAKKVDVFTNEPASPIKSFTMRCDVSQAVVAAPSKFSFGRHPRGTPASGKLLLKSPKEDASWTVTACKGTRRTPGGKLLDYRFETKPVDDPRFRVLELTLHHPGLGTPGAWRDGIVIKTTHRERPEVLVQAHFAVVERIIPVPQRMPLGFISPGARRPPRRVILRPGTAGVRFDITKVTFEAAAGRPALPAGGSGFVTEHGKENGIAFVDVQYDGKPRAAGLIEVVLVVHTTDEQMPTVRIPVTATIRKR
ncbi:MAG: DUF1573 domain-containing protein [Planctomycetota bacterium]|nr:DUF1573 domain-containing protein [Planctomycetota bacterium]